MFVKKREIERVTEKGVRKRERKKSERVIKEGDSVIEKTREKKKE